MASLKYFFIWTTKRRKPLLTNEIKKRLEEIINEVARKHDIELTTLKIHPTYIQLTVSAKPGISPHHITRIIKSRSSRILREEFPELLKLPSLWTRKYTVSTEQISEEAINTYVEKQSKK